MNWNGWADFLSMGGYAIYVWGSVLATWAWMITELWLLRRQQRAILHDIRSAP